VLGPVWAGALFGTVGIGSPFLVAAALVATASLLALRIPRPPRRRILPDDSALAADDATV
jgi:hypothetical protein